MYNKVIKETDCVLTKVPCRNLAVSRSVCGLGLVIEPPTLYCLVVFETTAVISTGAHLNKIDAGCVWWRALLGIVFTPA